MSTLIPKDLILPALDEIEEQAEFQDEGESYNFRQLLDNVIEQGDVIFTVPSDQAQMLKTGLTTRKAKDNQKLKAAGIAPGSEVLTFTEYPAKDKVGAVIPGQTCVRVKMGLRRAITILAMELPDNKL